MTFAVALSVLVGVALGLLGGGGSILTVPILTYAAHLPAKQAIATSLFVVGATSLAALVPHARRGLVAWRPGLAFGTAGMLGAYAGGRLSALIAGQVLLAGFGLMMLATGLAMLRGRGRNAEAPARQRPPRAALITASLCGLAVGLVTGTLGAGGGFLIVPALVLFAGMPMRSAVATSLLVIAMQSLAGFVGHIGQLTIHWPLVLAVTAAAMLGSVGGGLLARKISARSLRTAFGLFVVAMGLFVMVRELPAALHVGAPFAAPFRAERSRTWPNSVRTGPGHDS